MFIIIKINVTNKNKLIKLEMVPFFWDTHKRHTIVKKFYYLIQSLCHEFVHHIMQFCLPSITSFILHTMINSLMLYVLTSRK